mmetsp:Transcript_14143/g.10197  ORF Transcript_14143/g.10197 Transcript_14143/m.10197 type:complete len:105 (+) Transcript_14143:212-526(+)
MLAVADGVGGWAESGIDPAQYSRRLCKNLVEIYEKNDERIKRNTNEILIKAASENNEIGSSTCVLAVLDDTEPLLYTSNLGDSGYLLLRKNGLDLMTLYKSKEQ